MEKNPTARSRRRYNTLRWMVQTIMCAGMSSIFVIVDALNGVLQHSAFWTVQSAVTSLDETIGGSIKRCLERVVGTCVGGFFAYVFFIALTWNESHTHTLASTVQLWVFILLWPLPWGYIRLKFPHNLVVASHGTFTGYIVVLASFIKGKACDVALVRVSAVCIGLMIAPCIALFVWPVGARQQLDEHLCEVMQSFADILHPLVEEEGGFIKVDKKTLKKLDAKNDTLRTLTTRRSMLYFKQARKTHAELNAKPLEYSLSPTLGFSPVVTDSRKEISRQRNTKKNEGPDPGSQNCIVHSSYEQECHQLSHAQPLTERNSSPRSHIALQPTEFSPGNAEAQSLTDITMLQSHNHGIQPFKNSCEESAESAAFSVEKEDEKTLKAMYQKTLLDIISAYQNASRKDSTLRYHQRSEALKKIQNCQGVLEMLPKLIHAAKKEIRWNFFRKRKRKIFTMFPDGAYHSLISQMKYLFHHIASLFFALDTEQRHDLSFNTPHGVSQPAPGLGYLHAQNHPSVHTSRLNTSLDVKSSTDLITGLASSYFFNGLFGVLVYKIVETICSAFIALSLALLNHSSTHKAKEDIDSAYTFIHTLQRLRRERESIYREVFNIAGNVASQSTSAKLLHSSACVRLGPRSETFIQIPWDILMGIETETFYRMSREEYQVYWECYWQHRDRLSVAIATLILLRQNLYTILENLDCINSYYSG